LCRTFARSRNETYNWINKTSTVRLIGWLLAYWRAKSVALVVFRFGLFAFAMGLGFIRGVKMHSGITKGSKYLNINRYRYRYIYWQTKYRRIDLC